MTTPRTLVIVLVIMLALAGSTLASTVYVSQSGGTFSGGNVCNGQGTESVSALNSSSPAAGTTIMFCGTITTPVVIAGNHGTSSNPITILFDIGAAVKANCNSGPGAACVSVANQSYILMDGNSTASGSPCGWVGQTEVSCNGTVESSATQPSNSNFGIDATGCANCEFRNLNIGPIYTVSSGGTQPGGDIRGIQFLPSAGSGSALVHNNIIHDASSGIVYVPNGSNDSGFRSYNNYEYNNNSGLDISNNDNGTLTAALVHDNYFGSTANWDASGCPNHHNSMHAFAYTTTNSGIQYYNNLITGNWGGCPTSEVFYEGSSSVNNNCSVFNNIFNATYTQENNGVVSVTCGGTVYFANNTVIGDYQSGDTCLSLNPLSGSSWTVENNIISSCNQPFASNTAVSAFTSAVSVWNYNVWGGTSNDPWALNCSSGCTYYASLSAWNSATGFDANSKWGNNNTYVGVNSNGTLQSTSPARGAGANLASLGILALDSDQDGVARPPWDDGALSYSSTSAPVPPSGLTAVVQ